MTRWRIAECSWMLGVAALGCGSTPEPDESTALRSESVELFSWWTAAGEAEALDALVGVFSERYPDVQVINAAAGDPTRARERLRERMDAGEPPDTFQAISGVDLQSWVARGKMAPLDDLAAEEGWEEVFPEPLLEVLRVDGSLYAVPVNIERDNNLYYNAAALAAEGLTAPESIEDFFAVCAALGERDRTALAVPAAGWVIALVAFENLMPGLLGGEFYRSFYAGDVEPDGPQMIELFETLSRALGCSNVETASASWATEAERMMSGEPPLLVMGDWATGYLEGGEHVAGGSRAPYVPGVDFDVVTGLGSSGLFVFNSAVFGLPDRALHPDAATELLRVFGSMEGQTVFNPLKGSTPARVDVPVSGQARRAADDLREASGDEHRLLPGYASMTTFDFQTQMNPALLVFAVGGARARQLDPEGVTRSEENVPRGDLDYMIGKLSAAYRLLGED